MERDRGGHGGEGQTWAGSAVWGRGGEVHPACEGGRWGETCRKEFEFYFVKLIRSLENVPQLKVFGVGLCRTDVEALYFTPFSFAKVIKTFLLDAV